MPYKPVLPTPEQKRAIEIARVGFMAACPFYAHFFYSECKEHYTLDIPTACTDGRNIWINPQYIATLKAPEAVFVFAHEVDHVICRDPQRMRTYDKAGQLPDGTPFDAEQFNKAADYVRNAGLLEQGVGLMNPAWLYANDVGGDDVVEEVYKRKYKKKPDGKGGSTYGGAGKSPKGAKSDAAAAAQGGSFDQLLPPSVDPVTGREDLPDEAEFKEAIARAAAAAKAMGNLPANIARKIGEILEPQVDWTEQVRMIVTGHIGSRHETWNRPNRRRLALNPIIIMPGKRGYGADTVVVAVDTSGSIYANPKALEAFWSEVGGVLTDVRPKRVVLIECDAEVQRVTEASSLDELAIAKDQGVKGGGGTRFNPVFEYCEREQLAPDTLIYLTDMQGSFPDKKPSYPVVWCSILPPQEHYRAPFGDEINIKL
jgi:predicted metal-dependent peptidase